MFEQGVFGSEDVAAESFGEGLGVAFFDGFQNFLVLLMLPWQAGLPAFI